MKIKFICDSAADIPQETAASLGIRIVPQTFTFDGETYLKDRVDMPMKEFFDRMRTSPSLPKTSQVTVDAWKQAFLEELPNCDSIIVTTMASVSSGTYQSAVLAKELVLEEQPNADITVVDSMSMSYVYGKSVIECAKLALEGKQKDELVLKIKEITEHSFVYFLVEDLKYLKMGGRINTATLVAANLMDIKPVLSIRDGVVVGTEKIRAGKALYTKFLQLYDKKGIDLKGKDIYIIHSLDPQKLDEFHKMADEHFSPSSITDIELGSTIGAHAGPGLCGILYTN